MGFNATLLARWFLAWPILEQTICSSETSVDFQETTRRYIPEDKPLSSSLCYKPEGRAFDYR
jgi:hypothetical protein